MLSVYVHIVVWLFLSTSPTDRMVYHQWALFFILLISVFPQKKATPPRNDTEIFLHF